MGLISSMIGFTLEIEDFIGESCIYNTQPYWCYIVKNGSPPFTVSRETIEDSGKERIRTEKVTQIAPVFFMYQQRIHWDNDEKKAVKSHAEVSIESELENGMKLWAVIRQLLLDTISLLSGKKQDGSFLMIKMLKKFKLALLMIALGKKM